jgi:hypothetical protein
MIINYNTHHKPGDLVYYLNNSDSKRVTGKYKTMTIGKQYTVKSSAYYWVDYEPVPVIRIELEEIDGLWNPAFFVSQMDWMLIDLAVFNLVYSNQK